MAEQNPYREVPAKKVKAEIESLLGASLSDAELRDRLEELSQAMSFNGFTWLWGPELYRRNRVLFRPFILEHFANALIDVGWKWERVEWKGEKAAKLGPWLAQVDADDETNLFKRLYTWKHSTGQWGGFDEKRWRTDLLERAKAASSPAQLGQVLEKFDMWAQLDEETAWKLYKLDHRQAGPFLLKHLSETWGERRKLWNRVFQTALDQGDEDFAFRLYRRQIDQKSWEREVLGLADAISAPHELCSELERRHPEGWGLDLGMTFFRLAEKRERDVFPYVQKHLRTVYRSWYGGRDGYKQLVKLASENEWWDLWSALVRVCGQPKEFNAEINRLMGNSSLAEEELQSRLLMLTGVSREWNFGPFSFAQVQQLEDKTAVEMYRRFPNLVRGPFKMNVSSGWNFEFPLLTEAAVDAEDETLIDYLASRLVTRADWGWGSAGKVVALAERLSKYYERFAGDDAEFSRRAVNVLAQVPAYSIFNYNQVIRTNRLARMLYERSAPKYLSFPTGVRDLLEAPEIHAQALAFRVLGLDSDDARRLGRENLDLLQATLLRPLHRKTRALSFRALENAAIDSETAARIHGKCREALDLPDKRYPKEQLIGLIGRLLHRWPELRAPQEQPVIFGGATV